MKKEIVIDFGGITNDNVEQLRIINSTSLPIFYPDGFYKDVVTAKNEDLNKYAYHNGFVIGSICCRIQDESKIYIMTLGVLPSYRGRNVGTKLVQSVVDYAIGEEARTKGIKEIVLHVQINNVDAIKLYERLGFEKGEMVENYYKRIDPPHSPHCHILRKKTARKEKMKTIEMQVPEGAEEGDSLSFSYKGKATEIAIPAGSKPGDILQIQVQVDQQDDEESSDSDNGELSNMKKVELHSSLGVTLDLYSSVPGHDKEAKDEEEKKDGSDGTYAMPWPAGEHLAERITSPCFKKYTDDSKIVVELGAGTGLCGLAFAAAATARLAKRKGDVKKLCILFTDMPSAIDLLEYNLKMNQDRLCSQLEEQNICAKALVWGNDSRDIIPSNVDLILGSDLLYNVSLETFKALSATIESIDICKKAKVILSVRWRKPQEERNFFEIMASAGYEFKLMRESTDSPYACDLEWREFGNPTCKRSNDFFTNSFVQVDGESKALKDVSEDDLDIMSDQEFDSFEKRFIQVYIGSKSIN
jgi:ribosomal protein S18 acetylase RimI-like enzyme/predicted nicotinamide N-methyase